VYTENTTFCVQHIVFTIAFQFLQTCGNSYKTVEILTNRWKFLQNRGNSYKPLEILTTSHNCHIRLIFTTNSYSEAPRRLSSSLPLLTEWRMSALSYIKIDPVSNFPLQRPSLKCYELMSFSKSFLKSRPVPSNLKSWNKTSCIESSNLHTPLYRP
jgi:hypothetical protein